ncbi:MAG: cytochrome C [Bacteroidetes bacterium B1(2017)]|nr:MAG: cytochrome C [Bacteroidetes bacterium B1(2017)]
MKLSKLLTLAVSFLLTMQMAFADAAEGEKLFKANCTACHAINEKVVGPALKDVHKRREAAWLLKWIKNSQALVKSGDPVAVQVFKENNEVPMTAFETLTDAQITSIVDYVKQASEAPAPAPVEVAKGGTGAAAANGGSGLYSNTTFYALGFMTIILLVIVFILARIRRVVEELYIQKFPEVAAAEKEVSPSWRDNPVGMRYKLFIKHPVVGTLVVLLAFTVVFGLYGFDYGVKQIGVQKGYGPEQPIKYSHELHAGKYKINCLYCHSGADKGKQASIPSPSTCMNCHMHVTASAKYDGKVSPEIAKIYAAVGWDAEKRAYDPSKTKTPIKWIRIHNLPDHAYFNHAQHVKIGKVECQACHGPIETMAVVSQQRSLQMGWCINCHREAKVDVANNDYYEKLHANLKVDGKEFITVAQNGGLECGKCHY